MLLSPIFEAVDTFEFEVNDQFEGLVRAGDQSTCDSGNLDLEGCKGGGEAALDIALAFVLEDLEGEFEWEVLSAEGEASGQSEGAAGDVCAESLDFDRV